MDSGLLATPANWEHCVIAVAARGNYTGHGGWIGRPSLKEVAINARRTAMAAVWILGLVLVVGTLTSLVAARNAIEPQNGSGNPFHTVCPSGPPTCDAATIQGAVDQAAAGDEIRIAAGTYSQLTARAGVTQVVYVSKSLALRGGFTTTNWLAPDPAANPTRLDAGAAGRALYVTGETNVRLEGLELTGGSAAGMGGYQTPWGNDPIDAGGGLYVVSATIVLERSRVFSNTAGYGGGLFVLNGRPTIGESTIVSNTATSGGGIALEGCSGSILAGTRVAANKATGTSYEEGGGGLYLSGSDAKLAGMRISANAAGFGGGGLYLSGGAVTVVGSEVQGNTAGEYGGGLYIRGSALHCSQSTVRANASGGYGGGLALRWSDVTLQRNTIDSNEAEGGGGLEAYLSDLVLTQNSLTHNRATVECGGAAHSASGTVWATGNLVSGNQAQLNGGGMAFCYGDTVLDGNTVISNAAGDGGGGLYFSHSQGRVEATLVRGNDALYGGGIGLREGSAIEATNTLVAENAAAGDGGGIYVEASLLQALHTTLARNDGPSGLCVTRHAGEGSSATFTNTILVSHTLGMTVAQGSHATLDATLWGAGPWANGRDWAGDGTLDAGTINLWQEPGFAAEGYHLGPDSAAVDAGIDAGVSQDVDGQPRPHFDGYDLGADEWWPVAVVKRAVPAIAEREQIVTYTVRLTNTTGLTAPVRLTDPLPMEVRFVGPLELSQGEGGYAAGTVTWTATLEPAAVGLLTWRISIAPDAPYSTTIVNRAHIRDPYGAYLIEGTPIYLAPRRLFFPLALK
jgi:uncharacterized repeat protein (TIGR01451 family)